MPNIEKRDLKTRPAQGEIVEVSWDDHFSFAGEDPPTKPVRVKSWGKLAFEGEEGVAISQTEVQEHEPGFPVDSIHAGQFIVRSSMTEIKKANGHKAK